MMDGTKPDKRGENRVAIQDRAEELLAPVTRAVRSMAQHDPSATTSVQQAMDTVRGEVSLVVREHAGMSDELLRMYEHMGIVFEVTRSLLALRDEREVMAYLMDHLRGSYAGVRFAVIEGESEKPTPTSEGKGGGTAQSINGDIESIPEWIGDVVERSGQSRHVCVADETGEHTEVSRDDAPLTADQVLVAPVFAGESLAYSVVMWRVAGDQRWESVDMQLMDSLSAFCGDVIRNFRLVQELQQMSMEMVRTLVNAVDQKDPYTSGHTNRVGYYATMLGAELGFDESALRTLEWSALLHDVGKIGIRDDVLKKPGKLTDEEFEHIKEHPLRGYEVVRGNPHMKDSVDGVLYHHERYDGKGYPHGLKGEDIPLRGRIIQIADMFDALTTTRSYRGAFPWREALGILNEGAGTVSDPVMCETFDAMIWRLYAHNPEAFDAIGDTAAELDLEGKRGSTGITR